MVLLTDNNHFDILIKALSKKHKLLLSFLQCSKEKNIGLVEASTTGLWLIVVSCDGEVRQRICDYALILFPL
jgi:hypothetical protein